MKHPSCLKNSRNTIHKIYIFSNILGENFYLNFTKFPGYNFPRNCYGIGNFNSFHIKKEKLNKFFPIFLTSDLATFFLPLCTHKLDLEIYFSLKKLSKISTLVFKSYFIRKLLFKFYEVPRLHVPRNCCGIENFNTFLIKKEKLNQFFLIFLNFVLNHFLLDIKKILKFILL